MYAGNESVLESHTAAVTFAYSFFDNVAFRALLTVSIATNVIFLV